MPRYNMHLPIMFIFKVNNYIHTSMKVEEGNYAEDNYSSHITVPSSSVKIFTMARVIMLNK